MSGSKSIVGGPDGARATGDVGHDIEAFARRHGMTPDEVHEMIERVGTDRDALEREAAKLRRP